MMFGRLPRSYDPRVPHLSALLAGRRRAIAPAPAAADYTTVLPPDLGMMANDHLGDCTCAALGHALQVWTANANPPIDTEPDSNIIQLYQEACGYNPSNPQTDQGGNEQTVLTHAMLTGIPVSNGSGRHHIAAFVEVDPSNQADVRLAIYWGGLAYIGFNVPDYAMQTIGQVWDVRPGPTNYVGGHAVILVGYDAEGPTCITWGRKQKMTWAFFEATTDEAYLIADANWVTATGKSPAGLSLLELEAQMEGLRQAA